MRCAPYIALAYGQVRWVALAHCTQSISATPWRGAAHVSDESDKSEKRMKRTEGDAKGQSPLPGVVYLQQSPAFLSVWRHCCQVHMRSSKSLVVFSSVLENFVAVVKISSLPEIFIADLLRGRREWGCMIGDALAGCRTSRTSRMVHPNTVAYTARLHP